MTGLHLNIYDVSHIKCNQMVETQLLKTITFVTLKIIYKNQKVYAPSTDKTSTSMIWAETASHTYDI